MGVQWGLYDLKNRRIFDLDKGDWTPLLREPMGPRSLAEVRAAVEAAIVYRGGVASAADDDIRASRDRAARRIWAFCEVAEWQIDLWCDANPDPPEGRGGWPCVDGRYCGNFDPDPCAEQMAAKLAEAV